MDIRSILHDGIGQLLDEELEMLKQELALGECEASYREECQLLIAAEQKKRRIAKGKASAVVGGEAAQEAPGGTGKPKLPSDVAGGVLVPAERLSPFNEVSIPEKTPFEIVSADVSVIRKAEKRKSLFREYVKGQPLLDEQLVDAHFSFFDDWELGVLLDCIQFSEAFLEKYLAALDCDRVARKQLFSEDFFMRHYTELDAESVLKKGKNPWRGKEDRSGKLDMFLRLKGVRF